MTVFFNILVIKAIQPKLCNVVKRKIMPPFSLGLVKNCLPSFHSTYISWTYLIIISMHNKFCIFFYCPQRLQMYYSFGHLLWPWWVTSRKLQCKALQIADHCHTTMLCRQISTDPAVLHQSTHTQILNPALQNIFYWKWRFNNLVDKKGPRVVIFRYKSKSCFVALWYYSYIFPADSSTCTCVCLLAISELSNVFFCREKNCSISATQDISLKLSLKDGNPENKLSSKEQAIKSRLLDSFSLHSQNIQFQQPSIL